LSYNCNLSRFDVETPQMALQLKARNRWVAMDFSEDNSVVNG